MATFNDISNPTAIAGLTYMQKVNLLKRRGIYLDYASSHGGGNRDHSAWQVEFRGPGLKLRHHTGYISLQVRCWTYSGKYDGKRACEREAKENAVDQLIEMLREYEAAAAGEQS
jgi:hypothetical protein